MAKKIFSIILCTALLAGCSANSAEAEDKMENQAIKTRADYEEYQKIPSEKYDAAQVDILLEAEDCEQNSQVTAESSAAGFSGTGYAVIRSNPDFKMVVDIPASQHYTVTAVHRADDHKENPLLINGAKVLSMVSGKEWQSTKAENIFLEKLRFTI